VPIAVGQTHALVRAAPALIKKLGGNTLFSAVEAHFHIGKVSDLPSNLPGIAVRMAGPLFSAAGSVVSLLGAVVTVVFLVVFMLLFGRPLVHAALSEARPERRERYAAILTKIYQSIGGYLGGLLLICTINATLASVFLALNRVPYFLPLGILSGFSSMVPYAGPVVAGTAISLLSWATAGVWHGAASAIYFAVYGQIEGNVLSPLIFRRTVNVNPLVVLMAVLYLADLAGVIGAVVAVPVVAVAQILLREVLRFRRQQLALARGGASPAQA
jgi:predicted PurR-regulated permease PerM